MWIACEYFQAQEAEQAAQLAEDNAAGLATVVEKDEPPEVSGDVHADAEETEVGVNWQYMAQVIFNQILFYSLAPGRFQ